MPGDTWSSSFTNNINVQLSALEAGSPGSRCQQTLCLVRAAFYFIAETLLQWPHTVEEAKDWQAPQASFIRVLISFVRVEASWTNQLWRPHLLILMHWELGFNIWISGGNTDIQTTAGMSILQKAGVKNELDTGLQWGWGRPLAAVGRESCDYLCGTGSSPCLLSLRTVQWSSLKFI